MSSAVRLLDKGTSEALRASVCYSTLSSILHDLLQVARNSRAITRLHAHIELAPRWRITCTFDGDSRKVTIWHAFMLLQHTVRPNLMPLSALASLGELTVHPGVSCNMSATDRGRSTATQEVQLNELSLSDIYFNVPVRRSALAGLEAAHAELERCRWVFATTALAFWSLELRLEARSHFQKEFRVLTSYSPAEAAEHRYEEVLRMPLSKTNFCLHLSHYAHVQEGYGIGVTGFLVQSAMSSQQPVHYVIVDSCPISEESASSSPVQLEYVDLHRQIRLRLEMHNMIKVETAARPVELYTGYLICVHRPSSVDEPIMNRRAVAEAVSRALDLALEVKGGDKRGRARSGKGLRDHEVGPSLAPLRLVDGGIKIGSTTVERRDLRRDPSDHVEAGAPEWLGNRLQRSSCVSMAALSDEAAKGKDFKIVPAETTRHFLSSGHIIGQLDKKFIVARMADGTIVLIDQHAAHERVLLETELLQYVRTSFHVHRQSGKPPSSGDGKINSRSHAMGVFLPALLVSRFQTNESQAFLAFWGFIVDSEDLDRTRRHDSVYIELISVPAPLQKRLSADKQAVESLLRVLAEWLDDTATLRRHAALRFKVQEATEAEVDDTSWQVVPRYLPPYISTLFASDACRNAIMFNDRLTPAQCQELIRRVSGTTFPFQCAHGRPSAANVFRLSDVAPASEPSPVEWHRLHK